MNILSQSGTDFFLTGGTALSRAYYNHRYSDDLDFFLSRSDFFDEQLDEVLANLNDAGYRWNTEQDYTRAEHFLTLKIRKDSNTTLKLDFVNDSVPLFGNIAPTKLFYRTDSICNILSNKLSAIFRFAAKDIADIREIALREDINWVQAIQDARQKEAGLELIYVSQILTGMPQKEFDSIAWINKPSWEEFQHDISRISLEMLGG